jgi:hypothetical protein
MFSSEGQVRRENQGESVSLYVEPDETICVVKCLLCRVRALAWWVGISRSADCPDCFLQQVRACACASCRSAAGIEK